MRYQGLEDYIATLSETEKEQYRHLIEECRQRDVEILKKYDESRKELENLNEEIEKNIEELRALREAVNELKTIIFKLHPKVLEQLNGHLFRHYGRSLN